ncbi:hypothetical protein BV394_02670 [Brevirhabdus pacifica]|uniref:Uncharacterized protein n=1 Tax=Brevirhabdus pacifica TaxID=1267768 RepID=A0A1U7DFW0_9RHOB|nr:ClpXP protease specificity-enhancing factor SspB [Brevirhabdus pacifica]APX88768.1 hypothetical protein BV394_02670 [Brevirhabdus pacifica]OWU80022.1 hypothetical protein ATO5_03350 [Loktanella sp. 22II-4b]PJJ86706.1 hypothetical protein CLV77_1260 [Brevirhabdus pacifica]
MSGSIEYGNLMHRAMRRLISDVLEDVSENGLPGDHHFFITYETTHPDVGMPDWLKARYPEQIMIVIQHWFEDLIVDENGFQITLNFGDAPVPLYVPFDALQTFVDPSVEFGLRFESQDSDEDEHSSPIHIVDDLDDEEPSDSDADAPAAQAGESASGGKGKPAEEKAAAAPAKRDAEVVSLDSFRK